MKENRKESVIDFLESTDRMNYFTKLKACSQNDNLIENNLKTDSYSELNQTISSLLRTSITILKNNESEIVIDVIFLLEMALRLLPDDEMELLDELYKIL